MQKDLHKSAQIIFKGLNPKALTELYQMATIRKLAPAEVFIKEGETDQALYIVLRGELKVVRYRESRREEIATLKTGDWVGDFTFMRKIPRSASVIAKIHSDVMVIDHPTLDQLSDRTQLFFFKRLNALDVQRINNLVNQQKAQRSIRRQLMQELYRSRAHKTEDYTESEIVSNIIQKVPRLPAYAQSMATKLLENKISTSEVAEIIKNDPSLAGTVMKTINSPFYGFKQKIPDINHAVVLLGFNEIYKMIMAESVRQTLPITDEFQTLYFHSVAISNIAFAVSEVLKVSKPAWMATIGLLHDLGKSVILLLRQQNPKLKMLIDFLDGAKLGALLLREWNLPSSVWQSVEFQSYPEFSMHANIPEGVHESVSLIYLSHLICDTLQGATEDQLPMAFFSSYKHFLNWEDLALSEFMVQKALPEMFRKIDVYPQSMKRLLLDYQKNSMLN